MLRVYGKWSSANNTSTNSAGVRMGMTTNILGIFGRRSKFTSHAIRFHYQQVCSFSTAASASSTTTYSPLSELIIPSTKPAEAVGSVSSLLHDPPFPIAPASVPSSDDIRSSFLSYFAKQSHLLLPSSSLLPLSDSSLLFINAGMAPFKDYFTGVAKPPSARVATIQRCLRAGGKHNDLDNVGYTRRHHTFFEMLGNFSFGGYFKEEAIFYAWQYLTEVLQLPRERLFVTIFYNDNESYQIWKKVTGWSDEECSFRIGRCAEKDNFWSMGDTGPCGPCTEIYWDHSPHQQIFYNSLSSSDAAVVSGFDPCSDENRFLEIWNLVFMQFERFTSGHLTPLQIPCVDTGMGLERISSILQGVPSNFDIDAFTPLRTAILAQLGTVANAPKDLPNPFGALSETASSTSIKVIMDHIRSIVFLLFDGVNPGSTGRGYVLRRILRRALIHGYYLGHRKPFLHELCPTVIETTGKFIPELQHRKADISYTVAAEERMFFAVIERGMKFLQSSISKLPTDNPMLPGTVAFFLYDSCGFPFDLTEMIARKYNITVDHIEFNRLMELQRASSQLNWQGTGDKSLPIQVRGWQSSEIKGLFIGYDQLKSEAELTAIVHADINENTLPEEASSATKHNVRRAYWATINPCPFYPTGGGQIHDRGEIIIDGHSFYVDECIKLGGDCLVVRISSVDSNAPKLSVSDIGKSVMAIVDIAHRNAVSAHHTSTHLLHSALRRVLGEIGIKVVQAGSSVTADRLRFDFTCTQPLTEDQICAVEAIVNQCAYEGLPVSVAEMPHSEAIESGAIGIFEEKYGSIVRVVQCGDVSTELCGGTHVENTRLCYPFKILSESAIRAGVRRIEAVAGRMTVAMYEEKYGAIKRFGQVLNSTDVESAIAKLQNQIAQLETEKKLLKKRLIGQKSWPMTVGSFRSTEGSSSEDIPVALHLAPVEDAPTSFSLKDDAEALANAHPSMVHVCVCPENGMCYITGTNEATKRLPSNTLLRHLHENVTSNLSQHFDNGDGGSKPKKFRGGGNALNAQGNLLPVTIVTADDPCLLARLLKESLNKPF